MSVFEKNNHQWNLVAWFLENNPNYTLARLMKTKKVQKEFYEWTFKNPMPIDFRPFG